MPQPTNASQPPLLTADGRPISLAPQEQMGRDLMAMLKPGDILSGRVVEQFADNKYLFTIRGRNLIAASTLPLLRDSVVQFQVLDTSQGLSIRLIDPRQAGAAASLQAPADQALTSDLGARLARLGLPQAAPAAQVLQAFEHIEAPLADPTRLHRALGAIENVPPERAPQMAAAHALLAKHGLPVTPALLGLAERAVLAQQPQLAASAERVLRQLAALLPPVPTTPSGTPSPAPDQYFAPPPPQAPAPPPTSAPVPREPIPQPASPSLALPTQPGNDPSPLHPAAPGLPVTLSPLLQLAQQVQHQLQLSSEQAVLPQTTDRPHPAPGEVSRPMLDQLPEHIRTELEQQTQLKQELTQIAQDVLRHHEPAVQALRDQVLAVVREAVADSILRPSGLDDYDLVLPLALHQQAGKPVPARLSVAQRQTRQGASATFLRLDLELEHLGPLSLRMNGFDSGTIAITVFATGRALRLLEAGHEALAHDLEAAGLDARVRFGDLLAEQRDA